MTMENLGWYRTEDESGGGTNTDVRELIVDRWEGDQPIYRDPRTVQKYYSKQSDGEYLHRFVPQYDPVYQE